MASFLTAAQQTLVGRLYDCALDDTLWRALCADLADLFGGASDAIVILENADGAHLFSSTRNFDEDAVRAWKRCTWTALKKRPGAKAGRSSLSTSRA